MPKSARGNRRSSVHASRTERERVVRLSFRRRFRFRFHAQFRGKMCVESLVVVRRVDTVTRRASERESVRDGVLSSRRAGEKRDESSGSTLYGTERTPSNDVFFFGDTNHSHAVNQIDEPNLTRPLRPRPQVFDVTGRERSPQRHASPPFHSATDRSQPPPRTERLPRK